MIDTVLFDLDGTLLPMDQNKFLKRYFSLLYGTAAPYGYADPEAFFAGMWRGVAAMVKNDGSRTNEEVFWAEFAALLGEQAYSHKPLFDAFYGGLFNEARDVCGFAPEAKEIVLGLKERGCRLILASNPVFPRVAHFSRLSWTGVPADAFSYVTSYENSHFCKPDPAYYTEIAGACGFDPRTALMVGNDVKEDGAARAAGMEVFLLTGCLINTENADLSAFPHGGFGELSAYLSANVR